MSQTAMFLQDIGSTGGKTQAQDAGTRAVGSSSKRGDFDALLHKKIIHARGEKIDADDPGGGRRPRLRSERGVKIERSPKRHERPRPPDRDAKPVPDCVEAAVSDEGFAAVSGGVEHTGAGGEMQSQGETSPATSPPAPDAQADTQGTPEAGAQGAAGAKSPTIPSTFTAAPTEASVPGVGPQPGQAAPAPETAPAPSAGSSTSGAEVTSLRPEAPGAEAVPAPGAPP